MNEEQKAAIELGRAAADINCAVSENQLVALTGKTKKTIRNLLERTPEWFRGGKGQGGGARYHRLKDALAVILGAGMESETDRKAKILADRAEFELAKAKGEFAAVDEIRVELENLFSRFMDSIRESSMGEGEKEKLTATLRAGIEDFSK